MATLGTMAVKLLFDTANFKRGAKDAQGTVKNLSGSLSKLGSVVNDVVRVGFVAAGAAMAAFGVSTIKTGAQYERTIAVIRSITGATSEDIALLSEEARRLGASTAYSATQAAEGMIELARAGLTAGETVAATENALFFAGAAGSSMARATQIIASAMVQFGISADESNRITDVFTKTLNSTLFDIVNLADAMKYAGVAGAGLGMTLEETTAAVSLFRNLGLQGTLAGNAFKMAMNQASVASVKKTAALKGLGLTMEDINPELFSFSEIMTTVGKAGIGTSESMLVFGARAGAAVARIAANFGDGTTNFFELRDAMVNSAGTAQETYAIAMDNVADQTKIVLSVLQELQITVFDGMKTGIKDILVTAIDILNTVVMVFNNSSSQINADISSTLDGLNKYLLKNKAAIAATFIEIISAVRAFGEQLTWLVPLLITVGKMMVIAFKVALVAKATAGVVNLVVGFKGLITTMMLAEAAAKAFYIELVAMSGGTIALAAAVGTAVYLLFEMAFGSDAATESARNLINAENDLKKAQEERMEAQRGAISDNLESSDAQNRMIVDQLEEEGVLSKALESRLDQLRMMSDATVQNKLASGELLEVTTNLGEEGSSAYFDLHTAMMLMNDDGEVARTIQEGYHRALSATEREIKQTSIEIENLSEMQNLHNQFVAQGHTLFFASALLRNKQHGLEFDNIEALNLALKERQKEIQRLTELQAKRARMATESMDSVSRADSKAAKEAAKRERVTKALRKSSIDYTKQLLSATKARIKMMTRLETETLKIEGNTAKIVINSMQRRVAEIEAVFNKEIDLAKKLNKNTAQLEQAKVSAVATARKNAVAKMNNEVEAQFKKHASELRKVDRTQLEAIEEDFGQRVDLLKKVHTVEIVLAESIGQSTDALVLKHREQFKVLGMLAAKAIMEVDKTRKEILSGTHDALIAEEDLSAYVSALLEAKDSLKEMGGATQELSRINELLSTPEMFSGDINQVLAQLGGEIGTLARLELELADTTRKASAEKLEGEIEYLTERVRINQQFNDVLATINDEDVKAREALERARTAALLILEEDRGNKIAEKIGKGFSKAGAAAKIGMKYIAAIGSGIIKGSSAVISAVSSIFSALTGNFKIDFMGAMQEIADSTKEQVSQIDAAVASGRITEEQGATQKQEVRSEAATNVVSEKIDMVTGLIDTISGIGAEFVTGLAGQIGNMISQVGAAIPAIVASLAEAIPMLLGVIVESVPLLLQGIVDAIPMVVDILVSLLTVTLPALLSGLGPVISDLISAIFDAIPKIMAAMVEALPNVVAFITDALTQIIAGIPDLVAALLGAIPMIITTLMGGINTLLEAILGMIPDLITFIIAALPDIILALITGLLESVIMLAKMIPEMIVTLLVESVPTLISAVLDIVMNVITALLVALPEVLQQLVMAVPLIITAIIEMIPKILTELLTGIIDLIPALLPTLIMLIPTLIGSIISQIPQIIIALVEGLIKAVPDVVMALVKALTEDLPDAFIKAGKEFVKKLQQFFQDVISEITSLGKEETKTFGDTPRPIYTGTEGAVMGFEPNDYVVAAKSPMALMSQITSAFDGLSIPGMASSTQNIPITIMANGAVLDKILVQSMGAGRAPKMSKKFRSASGVRLGYSSGTGVKY